MTETRNNINVNINNPYSNEYIDEKKSNQSFIAKKKKKKKKEGGVFQYSVVSKAQSMSL